MHPIADALDASHKELEDATRTALAQAIYKALKNVASKEPLDITNPAQLQAVAAAAAKTFGWDGKPKAEININNQVGVGLVCTEEQRQRLIALREKLLEPRPAMITLPAQLQASVDTGNTLPAPAEEVIEKPGPAFSAPAGAIAPSDASPTYRAWLEHVKAESEPGPEY